MVEGERTRLIVVAGLDRAATQNVSDRLMQVEPGAVVVHHDLLRVAEGVVHRHLRWAESESSKVLELAHGCVSCTLREDVLPLLRRLAERDGVSRIVLQLDPLMEPEPVCWTLASAVVGDVTLSELVDVEAVVAVVDEGTWLVDATGDEDLADRELGAVAEDDRSLAQVAVDQVAFADAVVLAGRADDGWTAIRLGAVLDRLAPGAPRTWLGDDDLAGILEVIPAAARRGAVEDAHAPLLRGAPPLEPDSGVALTLFRARRPFHPVRLHDTITVSRSS